MAFNYPGFVAPQPYDAQPDIAGNFVRGYKAIRTPIDENNAAQSLSALGQGLEQPADGTDKPALAQYGLPARDVLLPMLQNPETRDQALTMIRDASAKRDEANDPVKQLQLKKLQYDVAHQGDAPRDTVTLDANRRFALGRQQGLTGDALRTFTLSGKLPDAPGDEALAPDAATRFKLGRDQGLTGNDLKTFTLTGKLPDENGGGSLINAGGGQLYDPNSKTWISAPAGSSALSPEALDIISTQYLAGDKSAISGFARNPQTRAQIANAIATKANAVGMDGNAIAAEISAYGGNAAAQRAAGTRAAQVGMAASEANQMADLALDASSKVPRTQFVPWNQAVQMYQKGTSDPNLARMVASTTSLVNAYARAVSPVGQPTDAQRAHAEEMLNNAQSPEAYAAVIDQMKKEMEAALNAPAEISTQLKTSITGGAGPAPSGKVLTYNPATGELE